MWTIVYKPVGLRIKNGNYKPDKNDNPYYLPDFKEYKKEDDQTKLEEKDKENIKQLKIVETEHYNMVKVINS